ncbi:hypothetical protein CC85DRAFT_129532 [Cutaneotrichosporon oleaginosum]|uniref:DnaJ-domain-containing protein n=1 Tax=Cutaneotrichosporon oleaginosum TaxID=879819 RepID=A0A0J0XIX0_9TREE|nr:uncharacterized protein CC85DRAFT_129532 [Cutaneotrichosporon oleaginosum]KLT41026.1 hypothetical protein CC85DRAFT_129532 [Cutaneotrichosporon oleaginosum]TXT12118.1 hypothetical protein COLE_02528 [Cutaneotrichosporon oleaginosum]
MGNDQSRTADKEEPEDGPIDYYELLQVDIEATPEEIKKSYRKLALVNHPDKNPHRVEEATKIFADLQQAYEVLSDPNERAFYDRHRNDHIETNDDDFYDHVRAGDAGVADPKSKFNRRKRGDPGIKIDQLMRFFDPKLARKMDDSSEGFYSVYRTLFNVLASDEVLHTPQDGVPVHYPSFGDSTTPYAPPPGLTKAERARSNWARDFYTAWGEFTTEKRFEWVEKWDTHRAETREIRRLMEKENKKAREDHRKEYIDTVRTLVSFIQHRDPRFKAYQAEAKKKKPAGSGASTPRRAPRVDAEAAKRREEERMRAAEAFQEQEWQKVKVASDEEDEADEYAEEGDGTGIRMDDGAGGEVFECVACNKTFQSEASWSNHERSKKHKQSVWRMAKEMRAENAGFDEDDFATPLETPAEEFKEAELDDEELMLELEQLEELDLLEAEEKSKLSAMKEAKKRKEKAKPKPPAPVEPEPVIEAKPRASSPKKELPRKSTPAIDEDSDAASSKQEMSKRDKRRAREVRRKEEAEAAKEAFKEKRKEAKKAAKAGLVPPPLSAKEIEMERAAKQFIQPKRKGKAPKKAEKVEITDEDVQRAVEDVHGLRTKMIEKWGEEWNALMERLRPLLLNGVQQQLAILCLGLGKPCVDRTAKIQLALALELAAALGTHPSSISAFDPVFDDGDKRVLSSLSLTIITENLRGEHELTGPTLVYMPHCSKALYEAFFSKNYSPRLASQTVILGNDLGEYLPGFVRETGEGEREEEEFQKPKKKRKSRAAPRSYEDGVLRRLVPNFEVAPMSVLPETNLPGFARAFLSLAFQWLPAENVDKVDWETPLPAVVWPDDGEVA